MIGDALEAIIAAIRAAAKEEDPEPHLREAERMTEALRDREQAGGDDSKGEWDRDLAERKERG